MSLKVPSANGNMYDWVDRIWNPIKGECGFRCSYCYTHRWGKQKPVHLDEKALRADLGKGNLIFVCSGCDLFSPDVPTTWIDKVFHRSIESEINHDGNRFLWHTKNPGRFIETANRLQCATASILCVTMESNRDYPAITAAPPMWVRVDGIHRWTREKMITVEPILDFDTERFLSIIIDSKPSQVNIGADSSGHGLPEPEGKKINELIERLAPYTKIKLKKNLRRLLPEHSLYLEGK